jgi:hypothetical protein
VPYLRWPIRSILAGAAGTATLTAAYKLEHRLERDVQGPLDYDDSLVPGEIVANILRLPLLGRTPPPWRWRPSVLVTCLSTHVAYVVAVGVVDDRLGGGSECRRQAAAAA